MTQPHSTFPQRFRVLLRESLGACLRAVPLRVVQWGRRHGVLTSVLRHRSIAKLGSFTLEGDPPITLMANDSRLVRLLYWFGEAGSEPEEAAWWRRLCSRSTKILEIGANVGYYTVTGAAAAPHASYTAVEAHPESSEIVRQNLDLNHLTNVKLIHAAAVGEQGVEFVDLALPDLEHYTAPTGAFVSDGTEGVAERRAASHTIRVPAVQIATLVAGVDLIKLDIEGLEHRVLAPVIDTLVDHRAVILVEVLRDTPKLRQLLAELVPQGYELRLLAGHELPVLAVDDLLHADLMATFGCRDLVAVPVEKTALVEVR